MNTENGSMGRIRTRSAALRSSVDGTSPTCKPQLTRILMRASRLPCRGSIPYDSEDAQLHCNLLGPDGEQPNPKSGRQTSRPRTSIAARARFVQHSRVRVICTVASLASKRLGID